MFLKPPCQENLFAVIRNWKKLHCKLLGFGPLAPWPLDPQGAKGAKKSRPNTNCVRPALFGPRLPGSRGQGAKGPKPNNLQCNFFQFLMTANGFSWHGGLSVYKCVLWMKKILTFSAFPTDNSYFSKLIP